MADGIITIEAEDIIDSGFVVENNALGSGSAIASLFNSGATSGTLSYTFSDTAGVYTLTVFAFDENDGAGSIEILVNGEIVAVHDLNSASGNPGVGLDNLVAIPVQDLDLSPGDVIQIVGVQNAAEWVRIDRMTLEQTDLAQPVGDTITVEAEDIIESGYVAAASSAASGDAFASLFNTTVQNSAASGVLSYNFAGADGSYDLLIDLFDENDGQSSLEVRVNGVLVSTISMNGSTNSGGVDALSLTTRTVSGLDLSTGDLITITGAADQAEWARVDKLTFAPQGTVEPPANSAPTGALSDVAAETGDTITINLDDVFSDADNDALTYSVSGTGASFAAINGSILVINAAAAGDYSISVTANDGTVDSAPASFTLSVDDPGSEPVGDVITVEAEDIIASGYIVGSSPAASDGEFASLYNAASTTGVLSYTFAGGAGTYDLALDIFDENDGQASLQVRVNGVLVSTIAMNGGDGSGGADAQSLVTQTIEGLELSTGDVITVTGFADQAEWARVDKLTFTPQGAVEPPVNTAPTGTAIADIDADTGATVTINLDTVFSDLDNDALTYTVSGAGASIASINGSILTLNPTNAGDFAISVTANDGTADSLPVSFTVTAADPAPVEGVITVEAEDIIASGYIVGTSPAASDGEFASLYNAASTTGVLSYTFAGGAGTYDLALDIFDENDGQASLQVRVNGVLVSTIAMNGGAGSGGADAQSLVTQTIEGLELSTGDVITVTGFADQAEWARVDKLTFTPQGAVEPPVNTAPTGAVADVDADTGEILNINLDTLFTDVDNDVLTYTVSGAGASIASLNGSILTLNPTVAGAYQITIVANDGTDDSAPVTFTVTATDFVNTAPTGALSDIGAQTGETITINLDTVFTDVDNDALTYAVSGAGASIASLNGSILTLLPSAEGAYEITLIANDGTDDSTPVTFTVSATDPVPVQEFVVEAETIMASNYVAENSTFASNGQVASLLNTGATTGVLSYTFDGLIAEPGVFTLNVSAFDESDGVSTLTVRINGEIASVITLDNPTNNGAMGADNLIDFPVEGLVLEAGDVVTIEASLGGAEFARVDKLTFTRTDKLPNTAPTGDIADVETEPGASVVIDLDTVFSDAEGDALTYAVSGPGASIATLDGSTLTIEPTAEGAFDITVTANDGVLDSAPVTFTITSEAPNFAPEGTPSAILANGVEDGVVIIPQSALLAGLTDPEGDAMHVATITSSNGGILSNGQGSFILTTTPDFNGEVTLTYSVADSRGNLLENLTQTLNIAPVNDAPVIADLSGETVVVNEDETATATPQEIQDKIAALISDVDGDEVTVTLTLVYPQGSGHADETIVVDPNAELIWTPPADFNGDIAVTVVAEDPSGETDTAQATLTVAPVNDAPFAADETPFDIGPVVIGDTAEIDLSLAFADIEDQPLTFSISGAGVDAGYASLDGSTLSLAPTISGDYDIVITASDGEDDSSPYVFTLNAAEPNSAPTGSLINFSLTLGSMVTLDLSSAFTDVDGDVITYSISGTGSQIASLNGSMLTIAPTDRDQFGVFEITVHTTDGAADGAPVTFIVTVPDSNQAPIGTPTAALADGVEDQPVTILEADLLDGLSDPEGDPLSITQISASNGTVAPDGNGGFTLTTEPDFNGVVTLTYTVSDDRTGSLSGLTQTINIATVNDAPEIADLSGATLLVNEDETATVTPQEIQDAIAAVISDVDGDEVAVTLTLVYPQGSGQADEIIAVDPNAALVWTPPADFFGDIAVTVSADDGAGGSASAQTTLTVAPVNDAPVAKDFVSPFTYNEDETISGVNFGDIPSELVSDVDTPLSHFTAAAFTIDSVSIDGATPISAAEAGVSVDVDGDITIDTTVAAYQGLAAGQTANVVVNFTVVDDGGLSDIGTATFAVEGANDAPTAVDDAFDLVNDDVTPFTGNVLADNGAGADGDLDGDVVEVVAVTGAATAQGGVVTIGADGAMSYLAAAGFYGVDTFTYTVTDGEFTDTATITFNVTPDDEAPIAVDDVFVVAAGATVSGNVLADNGAGADFDPDGGTVSFTSGSFPAQGSLSISGDGSFTFTAPNADFSAQPITFTYVITDQEGDTDTGTVSFVYDPGAAPTSQATSFAFSSAPSEAPQTQSDAEQGESNIDANGSFLLSASFGAQAEGSSGAMVVLPTAVAPGAALTFFDLAAIEPDAVIDMGVDLDHHVDDMFIV